MSIEVIIGLLISISLTILLLYAAGVLFYYIFFNASARYHWELKRKSKQDYLSARGTQHLKMLREARQAISKKKSNLENQLKQIEAEQQRLNTWRDQQLIAALEKYLVYHRFTGVPGIGQNLREAIIAVTFRGRLEDLLNAHQVRGVGPTRYYAIHHWVHYYKQQIPQLINTQYPGKDEILESWDEQNKLLNQQKEELISQRERLLRMLEKCVHELNNLASVRPSDFYRVLANPESKDDRVEKYLIGCFSEWETVPDWFTEIISERENQCFSG